MDIWDAIGLFRRLRKWFATALIIGLALGVPLANDVFKAMVEDKADQLTQLITTSLENVGAQHAI